MPYPAKDKIDQRAEDIAVETYGQSFGDLTESERRRVFERAYNEVYDYPDIPNRDELELERRLGN